MNPAPAERTLLVALRVLRANNQCSPGTTLRDFGFSKNHRSYGLTLDCGRFIARDSIGIWGDLTALGNGYTYVGNNLYSFVDPFGFDGGTRFGLIDWKGVRNAPPTPNVGNYRPTLPFTCKFAVGPGCDPVWNPTTHRWEGCEPTFTYDSYCDCKKKGGEYLQAKPFWVWCNWWATGGPAPGNPRMFIK
jgi:hypothetical protein